VTSSLQSSRWPHVAAAWSGVHNSLSRALTLAPLSSNSCIMSTWPSMQHYTHTFTLTPNIFLALFFSTIYATQSYSKCQCKTTDLNSMSVCFATALLAESSLNHLVHLHASCSLEVKQTFIRLWQPLTRLDGLHKQSWITQVPLIILVFDASKCIKHKDHSLYLCNVMAYDNRIKSKT